jgi:V-type H+-transporting ATPase subunit E
MTSLETDAFELKRMMRQEAHEKSYEIQVMAQRLFEKEKDKIVQQGLETMNEEYDKKIMNLTMNLNIERSTKINQTRILRMTERNKCIDRVKEETKEQMLKTIVNPTNYMYKNAMKNLIIQVSITALKIYVQKDINIYTFVYRV